MAKKEALDNGNVEENETKVSLSEAIKNALSGEGLSEEKDDDEEDEEKDDDEEKEVEEDFDSLSEEDEEKDDDDEEKDDDEVDEETIKIKSDDKFSGNSVKDKKKAPENKTKGKSKAANIEKEVKKSVGEDLEIDVTADVEALMSGEESLSEDFKSKAQTIFEAAVRAKVTTELERIEEEKTDELNEGLEAIKTELSEKVDNYLTYVAEEWTKENEIALETGLRGDLAESFITGLKGLLEDHYIDVPEEKEDILESLAQENKELEDKLDEEVNKNIETKNELVDYKKKDVLSSVSEGLADTEKEKLSELSENVDFENEKQYEEKLSTLKENYFPKDKVSDDNDETAGSDNKIVSENSTTSMQSVLDALSRSSKK